MKTKLYKAVNYLLFLSLVIVLFSSVVITAANGTTMTNQQIRITNLQNCTMWSEFSNEQINTIVHSYNRGLPYNMQRTLAAISIVESSAGLIPINTSDPSAGVHHITLKNATHYLDWDNTHLNRQKAALLLIDDRDLSADMALSVLQWWHNRHGGNWWLTWASYKGGYSWRTDASQEYAANIKRWVDRLANCGW